MIEDQFGIQIYLWESEDKPSATHPPDWIDPAKYIPDVREQLRRIAASQAGRVLADALRSYGKKLMVMPYRGKDANAETVKEGPTVFFTPAVQRSAVCASEAGDRNAALPHEVFHHELIHALRRLSNKTNPRLLKDGLYRFIDTEEFDAILATNVFISDVSNKNKSGLRGYRVGHGPLEREFSQSFSFFSIDSRVYGVIARFCDENRDYTGMLKDVRASFNPIAAYLKNPDKAFHLSAISSEEDYWGKMEVQHMYRARYGNKP